MEEKTKFTIIIPTRERADTLEYTLANVVSQEYDDFEVLVSDNASEDHTHDVVKRFMVKHSNVRYINTQRRLSMSHNWEFALKHIKDGWLTFLGDDDGLLPGGLSYLDKIIRESGVSAIASASCGFAWPNEHTHEPGFLTVYFNDGFKLVRSSDALRKVIEHGYPYSILPVAYQSGFIDINLFRRAQSKTGSFFRSMIPDVYSGIVLSLLTDTFGYSYRPISFCGHSSHSGGAAAMSVTERNAKYNPASKFFAEENIPFHRDLPLLDDGTVVRSMQAIVYESYLQAAPFHDLKPIKTTHERQLYLILRDAGTNFSPMIEDWARKFATQHGIDLGAIKQRVDSMPTRLQKLSRRLSAYWFYLRHTMVVNNTPNLTMKTVYDAALVAGALLQCRPGWLVRARHIFVKARKLFF